MQTAEAAEVLTGLNEAMAENAFRWLDDNINFTSRQAMRDTAAGLIGNGRGRLDPKDMIAKMVEVIPARDGLFRNVFPSFVESALKEHQTEMFVRSI